MNKCHQNISCPFHKCLIPLRISLLTSVHAGSHLPSLMYLFFLPFAQYALPHICLQHSRPNRDPRVLLSLLIQIEIHTAFPFSDSQIHTSPILYLFLSPCHLTWSCPKERLLITVTVPLHNQFIFISSIKFINFATTAYLLFLLVHVNLLGDLSLDIARVSKSSSQT